MKRVEATRQHYCRSVKEARSHLVGSIAPSGKTVNLLGPSATEGREMEIGDWAFGMSSQRVLTLGTQPWKPARRVCRGPKGCRCAATSVCNLPGVVPLRLASNGGRSRRLSWRRYRRMSKTTRCWTRLPGGIDSAAGLRRVTCRMLG